MQKNSIAVSVLCNVYNHEKYLEECLTSLVNQKTNFKYEILVHDDCSTDSSVKIINDFYRKYPNKIVPFFEHENQYSKGVKITKDIMISKIKGKYFCFCEGDDYWTDNNKLQKQYDFLENNPDYKFCVHNSIRVNKNGIEIEKRNTKIGGGDLTCEDFIISGGSFVATNSIFSYSSLTKKLPKCFDIMATDYIWQIYLSSFGKTYCFNDYMSAYRIQSDGSWTCRMLANPDQLIKHKERLIKAFKCFDKDMNYRFHSSVEFAILKIEYAILLIKKDYKSMRSRTYKKIYKKEKIKTKIKYFLDEHFPRVYNKIKQIRSKK